MKCKNYFTYVTKSFQLNCIHTNINQKCQIKFVTDIMYYWKVFILHRNKKLLIYTMLYNKVENWKFQIRKLWGYYLLKEYFAQ